MYIEFTISDVTVPKAQGLHTCPTFGAIQYLMVCNMVVPKSQFGQTISVDLHFKTSKMGQKEVRGTM